MTVEQKTILLKNYRHFFKEAVINKMLNHWKNNMEGNQNNIYFYFSYLTHKMPKDPLEDWQKDEPFW